MDDYILLNDFVEGSISIENEELLFLKLSSDEEMRIEFKQILAVNSTIKNNKNLFNFNSNTKQKLFSALGLAIPGGIITDYQKSTSYTSLSSMLPKLQTFIGTVISAMIGGVIVFFIMNAMTNIEKSEKKSVETVQRDVSTLMANKNKETDLNAVSTMMANNKIETGLIPVTTIPEQIITNPEEEKFDINSITLADMEQNYITILKNRTDNREIYSKQNELYLIQPEIEEGKKNITSDWSVDLRNNFDFHIPRATIEPKEHLKYNNLNLALLYSLWENISLGLDIRQENFYMEYFYFGIDGLKRTHQQQPNFTSYDVFGKWRALNLDYIEAWGELTFGANVVGYVARSSLNIILLPGSNLNFGLGIENSWMIYEFKNKLFYSTKIGVNYGLIYNF